MAEAIVLILDVGPHTSQASSGSSFFEESVKCISWILQRKIFASSKDEVALVIFGTKDTQNNLCSDDQYQNITQVSELQLASWDLLTVIKDLQPGPASVDFVDALIVGLDNLCEENVRGKKFENKKVVLFSNFGCEVSEDQLDTITKGMKNMGVELTVVGPDLNSDKDNHSGKSKSAQQVKAESVIKTILKAVEGAVYTFEEALPVLEFFQKKSVRSAPWKVDLEIGSNVSIPVESFLRVTENKLPSWKRKFARDDTPLSSEVSFHINNEEQTEIEITETVKAFRYGSTLVPFSEEDKQNMQYVGGAKCLSVLGFTKRDNVPRHHYQGNNVRIFVGRKDDKVSITALSALIHALYETDMVAIVRYGYAARTNPKLACLIPYIKAKYECLIFVLLPFMEDLRQFTFASLTAKTKHEPSEQQLEAIDKLIDTMNLVQPDESDSEKKQLEYLKPKTIMNPASQRAYQCLAYRCLNPDEPLPEIEPSLKEKLEPDPHMLAMANPTLEIIKREFPLEIVMKRKQEMSGAEFFKSDEEGAKKPRLDSPAKGMAQLIQGPVSEIGTVNPVENFSALLKQEGSDPAKVCKEMQDIVFRIVTESFGNQYYPKAMNCLKVLRSEAVTVAPQQFNEFLRELKSGLKGKTRNEFWKLIVEEKVSLVTSNESGTSNLSASEAEEFLKADDDEEEQIKEEPLEEDVEDLLDAM